MATPVYDVGKLHCSAWNMRSNNMSSKSTIHGDHMCQAFAALKVCTIKLSLMYPMKSYIGFSMCKSQSNLLCTMLHWIINKKPPQWTPVIGYIKYVRNIHIWCWSSVPNFIAISYKQWKLVGKCKLRTTQPCDDTGICHSSMFVGLLFTAFPQCILVCMQMHSTGMIAHTLQTACPNGLST